MHSTIRKVKILQIKFWENKLGQRICLITPSIIQFLHHIEFVAVPARIFAVKLNFFARQIKDLQGIWVASMLFLEPGKTLFEWAVISIPPARLW
jgi:hypothetical protein